MENVLIGKVYRHFKGNYYYVLDVGYSSETQERMVLYKPLYGNDNKIWIRTEKMFLEKIDLRNDNITGQKYRFELVNDLTIDLVNKN